MSEMLTKVARAIWERRRETAKRDYKIELEAWGDGTFPKANHIFEEAHAAIEAMRDPTEAMVDVGMQEFADPCWPENVRAGFGKMIDAALQ